MVHLPAAEFDQVVERALRRIPRRFRKLLDNVVLVVEEKPPRPNLLGLYQGRPRTVRGVSDSFVLPDQITIYQRPHEQLARTVEELEQMVADTVWHEVGHYFGMSEFQIRQAERRFAHQRRANLA
jgi:predicted Zn-dependent protease with MMP-like domain